MKTRNEQYFNQGENSVMFVAPKGKPVMSRGKGMWLFDSDNNRYLDFIGGWAVNCLGHSHPVITKALIKQGKRLINASPSFYNEPQIEFAKMLSDLTCMDKVFFTSTGAEANEGAVKLARKYGSMHKNGAYEIITTTNSFHGRTLAMMAATGKPEWQTLFPPMVSGFIHVPFNDIEAVRLAINEKTIAIMIEPVQGEGGAIPATDEYVKQLRDLCDRNGLLLIFDEVQTGYARTGTLWAYQQYGIEPDIMTLAKGIGGGFPLGALLAKEKFCVFEVGNQGGTYSGQPLAMAVGKAVLEEIIRRDLPSHVKKMNSYIMEKLRQLESEGLIDSIRGKGLLIAFDVKNMKGSDVVAHALEKGLILNSPRPQSIRLIPPLIVNEKEIDIAIGIIRSVIA